MSLSERELMDNREIYIFPIESRGGKPEDGLAFFDSVFLHCLQDAKEM